MCVGAGVRNSKKNSEGRGVLYASALRVRRDCPMVHACARHPPSALEPIQQIFAGSVVGQCLCATSADRPLVDDFSTKTIVLDVGRCWSLGSVVCSPCGGCCAHPPKVVNSDITVEVETVWGMCYKSVEVAVCWGEGRLLPLKSLGPKEWRRRQLLFTIQSMRGLDASTWQYDRDESKQIHER